MATLVHTLNNNKDINSNENTYANDTAQAISRNVVLKSIKNELSSAVTEINSLSTTIEATTVDTDKRLEYVTVVLDNLYSMVYEICSQLVELYIAVGRASEAALIGKTVFNKEGL